MEMTDQTPVEQVLFPVFEGLTFEQEEYLLLPYQNGTLLKNPVENLFQKNVEVPFWLGRGRGGYINEYPAGFSYQFWPIIPLRKTDCILPLRMGRPTSKPLPAS